MGFMQFGFVAIYLSESFIRGFMTAAGLQILISTLVDIFRGLPETNVASLVFALVGSVVLIVYGFVLEQFVANPTVCQLAAVGRLTCVCLIQWNLLARWPGLLQQYLLVKATLVLLLVFRVLVYRQNLSPCLSLTRFRPSPLLQALIRCQNKVRVARLQWEKEERDRIFSSGGSWRSGSPNTKRLCFSCLDPGHLVAECVAWKQQVAASKHSIEMLALGCSNFLGSFFKIHVICCALSVTLAVDSAGGTSQFASLCVMLVVMVTMLSLGAFLKPLPKTGLDPGKLILARRKFLEKEEKGKEKEERKEARKRKSSSLIISQLEMQDDFDTSSPRISYVNFHSGDANVGEQDPPHPTLEQDPPTLELKPTPFHTLILDLPGVCFMDLTGINTLIKAGGAFDDGNISRSNLFLSVHDAVVFAQQSSAERRVSWE
ncbi:hypothetical protein F7725_001315, partial [Dissostichus mawsoni]